MLSSLLVLVGTGLTGANSTASAPESLSFLFVSAPVYDPGAWMNGGERFPVGATIMLHDSNGQLPLVPEFASSADPVVSFDGRRVMFSGRLKPKDQWQIWELSLGGGKPRQISSGPGPCVRPLYLPEDRIVYARKIAGRLAIEVANLSGRERLQLTYSPADFLPNDVLRDGRILFESGFPLGEGSTPELYTVYPDGSGVESYRCDHGKPHIQARQVLTGEIVFASNFALTKFTSAKAHQIPISIPAGEYVGDLAETDSGEWLLPWRKNAKERFRIMRWTPRHLHISTCIGKSRRQRHPAGDAYRSQRAQEISLWPS